MKYIILTMLVIVALGITLTSCDTRLPIGMSDLKCSQEFGFETDRLVFVTISGQPNSEVIIKNPSGYTII